MALKIAVIGAGMAGIQAARMLAAQGHALTVFEKSRGTSGRMSTRRAEGWACDHGAQYFTARSPAFQAQVQAWVQAGVVAPWDARICALQAGVIVPSESIRRYVGTPRMSAVVEAHAQGLTLVFNTRVTGVRAVGEQAWSLTLEAEVNGHATTREAGPFDRVIWAIPLPQLQALASQLSDGLQQQLAGLKHIHMLPCWTAMVRYAKPQDLGFDGLFANRPDVSWLARNSSKPSRSGEEVWVLHATPQHTRALLEAPKELVADQLEQVMRSFGAEPALGVTVHRWLYALSEGESSEPAHYDPASGMGFCGDFLLGGRVEGAYLSGTAMATRLRA